MDRSKLNTAVKIQDFLDTLKAGDRKRVQSLKSPTEVLKAGRANCMEGALLAGAILHYHKQRPLLMDLRSNNFDYDHVVALFQVGGYWGALSKTSHAVLRYRDPIYKNLRELALSYFHEYFLDDGTKTLRSYSLPYDLVKYHGTAWIYSKENLWSISKSLDNYKHVEILSKSMLKKLRKADKIERMAGKLREK